MTSPVSRLSRVYDTSSSGTRPGNRVKVRGFVTLNASMVDTVLSHSGLTVEVNIKLVL